MVIELKNLKKTYKSEGNIKVHAIDDVSLKIPSNEIFGIIGKSGAGKSTLVRLISLLEKCDFGEVWYDGVRVDNLEGKELIERRRKIGMIFQNFNLFSSRNAEQNIAYPLEICGVPKNEIKKRTAELLELVGLADRAKSPVSQLSGGQKQRIAIARALANNPDILFCDEATSALDPKTTQSILNLIREIQKKMNLTVVMITHQMEVVRDACSQVAVVSEGKIVELGKVEEIFLHPKTEITKDFLAHISNMAQQESKNGFVRWSGNGGKYTLHFNNEKTDEPILSQMAKKFDIEYNVRAGGVQSLQGKKVGTMLIDFIGDEKEISKAIAFLNENDVEVEKDGNDN
ncbi:methionine ABC transporter ATP-binding protein [Treponema pectinovorum]|uniref:methionine ABC transporter ATP-binding protein n=1 Tax=Treponema pectinovorum TaxID=164 RepID=UPI0011C7E135|nr:methionine ABC transporter ATP-binding protein [Treponema pectinovorum]